MTWFWRPSAQVDEAARRRGLQAFLGDGVCSQVRESLHSGPLLVGYALLLGVSNTGVGLIAAIGPLTQILQLPTVAMIKRWRRHKAITWVAALASRLCWAAALALPWMAPASARLPALFVRTPLRALSTVPGAREIVELPFSLVALLVPERRQQGRERARRALGLTRRRPPG